MEAEATFAVQRVIAISVMLYLCKHLAPSKIIVTPANKAICRSILSAPFVIDAVEKMF